MDPIQIFLCCLCFMAPLYAPSSKEGPCALALHARADSGRGTTSFPALKWMLSLPLSVHLCPCNKSARLLDCARVVRPAACQIY